MRITRTDDPAKGGKPSEPQAKAEVGAKGDSGQTPEQTVEALQRELNALTGRKAVTRDRAVLNRMIGKLQNRKAGMTGSTPDAAAPTVTQRLAALTEMNLAQLREEFERVTGKPSLSRNRKVLVRKIATLVQEDAATTEAPPEPVAKPTLTVPFHPKKRGRATKAGGKATGRPKAKAAPQGKQTATKRQIRPAEQRDLRLPKAGTTITREWHNKKYLVRVLEDGFEYDGKPYRSLSALAKHITGQIVNGFAWFSLTAKGKQTS